MSWCYEIGWKSSLGKGDEVLEFISLMLWFATDKELRHESRGWKLLYDHLRCSFVNAMAYFSDRSGSLWLGQAFASEAPLD